MNREKVLLSASSEELRLIQDEEESWEESISYYLSEAAPRLDLWLVSQLGISRNQVQKLISSGAITVGGKQLNAAATLQPGLEVAITWPLPRELQLVGEDIPLDIVYEDSHMVVVNKAKGMVVHPAVGNWTGTLVQALLYHCRDLQAIGGTLRPGIVHRLDKDTTGLLVVAKNENAMNSLSHQLKERSMTREYLALVWGGFADDTGSIALPIGRHPKERQKMAVTPSGRAAQTDYRVLARFKEWSWLALTLYSGRTHQIRVHLSHSGHPVVGDPLYGSRPNPLGLTSQGLHAWRLCLDHPASGNRSCWESQPPPELSRALELCALRK
ncbi:MAG: RluA family pseudouridine synthase [Symbiobacteriaceae bacterium]|nr:RluA family pseudouridine synthase [Symbiobacteriaceae bacterium]